MGQKPYDLKERTFEFALRILDITPLLPNRLEVNIARRQLARSGPAIGANVEEADGASTKRESRRIFIIARREARETRYWLRIIERKWPTFVNVTAGIQEATEIVNILSSIINKLG
ncbi:MAG: four helix bundle protein [Planctomycetes bacterium]|nr:four helix bundle protein [Planctomycetota bacterium]